MRAKVRVPGRRSVVGVWLLVVAALVLATTAVADPPATAQRSQAADADGDKVADENDVCPSERGPSQHGGCPLDPNDEDDDGVANGTDWCPGYAGPPPSGCSKLGGDPGDQDGDGVPDSSDRCPTFPGAAKRNGCHMGSVPRIDDQAPEPASPKPVAAGTLSFDPSGKARRGAPVALEGLLFRGDMQPRTLTFWLPKGFTISPKPLSACSRAKAEQLKLGSGKGCAQLFAGRLTDRKVRAWFAYIGPISNGRRQLFIRDRRGDRLSGLAKGSISRPAGGFGPKVTLELGALGVSTRIIEIGSAPQSSPRGRVAPLRMGGPCPTRGLRYKIRLTTSSGSAERTARGRCV